MMKLITQQFKMKPPLFPEIQNPEDQAIDYIGNIPFIAMHAGCLLVFWVGLSKTAVLIFFITLLPRMFGLTAGYHRYFSHRSFKTSRVFQFILAFMGACSLQRDPLWWAAHHRNHHRHTDTQKDSHSPVTQGFWWSHIGWVMNDRYAKLNPDEYVPDFSKFRELRFLNRHQKYPAFFMLGLLIMTGLSIQFLFPQLKTSLLQVLVAGFFLSTVFLFHVTFSVNSFSHMFGSRPYPTKDDSRNNIWVALLTMGEGWHNNHHRYPFAERHTHEWWQLDMTHEILKILAWLGIVWDLKDIPKPQNTGSGREMFNNCP